MRPRISKHGNWTFMEIVVTDLNTFIYLYSEKKMIGVRFPRSILRPRGDDKQLTSEEAEEKITHLTAEQRIRLREVLQEKVWEKEHPY